MSDVSAVVLTMGEATTEAALASLRAQTLPPHEIIVVRGVSPFHQAINAGARQVTTPFFVQVDADMILDPGCLAELRGSVRRDSGIMVGELRDALMGQVVGIKLFRTAPFRDVMMGDTISPDTDLGGALSKAGWKTVYLSQPRRGAANPGRTYGEHRPDYRPEYTYRKYLLEGRRYRYRGNPDGIRWHFGRLETSLHGSAVYAQIGLANGIFLESTRDLLGPREVDDQFAGLASFLDVPGETGSDDADGLDPKLPFPELFARYYQLGRTLFGAGRSSRFRQILGRLRDYHKHDAALIATVGLCRGLLAPAGESPSLSAEFAVLREFLASTPEPTDGWALGGLVSRLRRWLRPGKA